MSITEESLKKLMKLLSIICPTTLSPGMKLGKNHSHFLLVDDGYVNRFGGETQFRTNLEYAVIDHKRKCTK